MPLHPRLVSVVLLHPSHVCVRPHQPSNVRVMLFTLDMTVCCLTAIHMSV